MYLGVEIGGTKLQVGVCDRQGRVRQLERATVVRSEGAAGIRRQLEAMIPPLLKRYRVTAMGVGFGGPVDVETGRAMISHQIAGWDKYPLRQWFVRRFGLPTVIGNDQDCAVLAEARCGAGKGKRIVFYVTVGTGIGGGLAVDGKLYNGRYGAAEIGHTKLFHQGRWRTVESLASGLAIEHGVSSVSQAARHLGAAIANTIAIVNPDVMIVGGGVATAGEKFWRPLRQTVARLVFPIYRKNYRLVLPKLGRSVVVVGAALLAADQGV
jgi:glucokinase